MADPELFLKTYLPDEFRQPFGRVHSNLIDAIVERAKTGGKKAVAAPRKRGKSTVIKGMNIYLVLAEMVRFLVPICATGGHAGRMYKDFRNKFATNDLLLEDFPEVCYPVRELDGAPQRAAKQHVDGILTKIVWTAGDYLRLPDVPGSPYGGVKMAYYGMDAAFRGLNIDGDRPDYLIIDDPETRESAKSISQIEDRIEIIEKDIEGLEGQDSPMAITMVTTIQNRYCLSFQFTDPEIKPAWDGERYGWIAKWPDNMDLWDEYIARRQKAQKGRDRHAIEAVEFYLSNRDAMHAGSEMLAENFLPVTLENGTELVHSALQEAFNKISDTSMAAFRTEYQNDPEPEEEIQKTGLTPGVVQSRVSHLRQREVESDTEVRVVGIDLGKYQSHWVDTAWRPGAIGDTPDYGVMETHGLSTTSDSKAIEIAILASLETWADEVVATIQPELCLIDSGTFTQAAYEFCRRRGRPFYPSKGWDWARFRMPKRSDSRIPFQESYASRQVEERVWLYNVNTEWWKKWLQERFLVEPWILGTQNRNAGSLCLFNAGNDAKRHLSFSHHICSEEERFVPVDGKSLRREWYVKNRNNHWLDAMALACAGAGVLGVRTIAPLDDEEPEAPSRRQVTESPFSRHGRPYLVTQR